MHRTTNYLTSVQGNWPRFRRLALITQATPPAWALAAARRQASWLTPGERAHFQADGTRLIDQLGELRRKWCGTLLLAIALSIAVVARASQVPMDAYGMAIFGVTMYAILLPALIFQIGISYDLIAAVALQQALRVAQAPAAHDQRGGGSLVPSEVYVVSQAHTRRRNAERVDQDIERQD